MAFIRNRFTAIPPALLILRLNGDDRSLLRSLNYFWQRTTSAPSGSNKAACESQKWAVSWSYTQNKWIITVQRIPIN